MLIYSSSPLFSEGDITQKKDDVSKYNVGKDAAKRTYDDIVFDSVLEMRFYRDVVLPMYGSGEITNYELQKEYILQPAFTNADGKKVKAITYVADFYLEYSDGRKEVIDTKGCPDVTAKIKRKMFWYKFPEIPYYWKCYSGIDGGWVNYEYLQQQRKIRKKLKEQKENDKNGKKSK